MPNKIRTIELALELYKRNLHLNNSFGEFFGKNLIAEKKYQNQPMLGAYKFTFQPFHKNIQETVHGGALATMIDIATTISMLRLTKNRTISISLNTQFLRVVKIGEQVQIQTQVTKIGKNFVFSDCHIYTNPGTDRKLASKGGHIKAIMHQQWNFVKEWQDQLKHKDHQQHQHILKKQKKQSNQNKIPLDSKKIQDTF